MSRSHASNALCKTFGISAEYQWTSWGVRWRKNVIGNRHVWLERIVYLPIKTSIVVGNIVVHLFNVRETLNKKIKSYFVFDMICFDMSDTRKMLSNIANGFEYVEWAAIITCVYYLLIHFIWTKFYFAIMMIWSSRFVCSFKIIYT